VQVGFALSLRRMRLPLHDLIYTTAIMPCPPFAHNHLSCTQNHRLDPNGVSPWLRDHLAYDTCHSSTNNWSSILRYVHSVVVDKDAFEDCASEWLSIGTKEFVHDWISPITRWEVVWNLIGWPEQGYGRLQALVDDAEKCGLNLPNNLTAADLLDWLKLLADITYQALSRESAPAHEVQVLITRFESLAHTFQLSATFKHGLPKPFSWMFSNLSRWMQQLDGAWALNGQGREKVNHFHSEIWDSTTGFLLSLVGANGYISCGLCDVLAVHKTQLTLLLRDQHPDMLRSWPKIAKLMQQRVGVP
jgi:hypothetical protein